MSESPPICQLEGCTKRIPNNRGRGNARYCTSIHQRRAATNRRNAKAKAERKATYTELGIRESSTERKGEVYRQLIEQPHLVELLIRGEVQPSYVAHLLSCTTGAVTRALAAVRTTMRYEEMAKDWRPSWKVRSMLPAWKLSRIRELGYRGEDTDEFQTLTDELVAAYGIFSRYYFRLEGNRPKIRPFHDRWIRSIIVALATGGKQLIISPPRHGKSEMLVRFAVWLIVMEPNIRVMWVAANKDVAGLMLGAVRDHLENNEVLIHDTLPPGNTYKPNRQGGKPWSNKEIKVDTMSHIGQKSSSMLALGRTAKILSRDVDLLIVDDLEDFDTTREPGQRRYSRNKFAEIGSRKEEHTAWVNICSRQHPDDIPNHLMKLEGNELGWRVIVDTAHQTCDLDQHEIAGHDENGCVLFPKVRSYRWLLEKKYEMDALGIPGAYEMRYLNRPIPEEGRVFDIERIEDNALNRERGLGLEGLPLGRLVGGLDPSARGVQAAFLWHYSEAKLAMVDLETQRAGGIDGAIAVIIDYYLKYGCTMWFYETNAQQSEFYKKVKEGVHKEMNLRNGSNPIVIKGHNTGKNKQDAELGISAMAPLYHDGRVDLPFGTSEARLKVNMLMRQLELWTTDGVSNKKALTDIKMAQWFPFAGVIERWMRDARVPTLVHQEGASYPQIDRFSHTPWHTAYPNGG